MENAIGIGFWLVLLAVVAYGMYLLGKWAVAKTELAYQQASLAEQQANHIYAHLVFELGARDIIGMARMRDLLDEEVDPAPAPDHG